MRGVLNMTRNFSINYRTLLFLFCFIMTGCASTTQSSNIGSKGIRTVEGKTIAIKNSARANADKSTQKNEPVPEKIPSEFAGLEEPESLGDMYLNQGLYYKAYAQYQKILADNPRNKGVLYKKGLSLFYGKKNDEAIKAFKQVLDIDPGHALSDLMIGRTFFQMGDYDGAEPYLKQASALDPTLWNACNLMGMIHDYRHEYKEAIEDYAIAIEHAPDMGLLYHNLGLAYYMNGEYEKAVKAYNQALSAKYLSEKTYNNLALALAKTGNYDAALEAFTKGGDKASAYNNLGCIYMGRGEYGKAIDCFNRALDASPTYYALADDNLKKAKQAVGQ
jgi:tetratricopeptide (TPR) repeat protein